MSSLVGVVCGMLHLKSYYPVVCGSMAAEHGYLDECISNNTF